MANGLNRSEKEQLERMQNIGQVERENKQLRMLYTQEASAKSQLHREKEQITKKLEKKREKLHLSES